MAEIKLSQNCIALVDDEDYERIASHGWYAARVGGQLRAQRRAGKSVALMHREVMNAQPGTYVDHVRHFALGPNVVDNRKSNLRFVTMTQNLGNGRKNAVKESPFKGVSRTPRGGKWRARIRQHRRAVYLGAFTEEAHAAMAYDLKAVELYGEFALTNFPVPGSTNWIYG